MSLGTLGKYELLEKIAEGGMGELFRARSIGPGGFERIVALKRIRPSMIADSRSRQMFIEEAKIASFVSHPNLVTLYEFEEEGDLLYLVMELIEGRDLAKILARCRQMRDPLRIALAVRIAEQVAQGLDYLHRLGQKGQPLQVVHRDVSPQNVLISFDGAVKLTDFGIAYMRRSEPVTQAGILKGKMGYLTPEQLSETRIDGRADIFCLGIVLWEMLTGARLFQGTSDAQILEQVLHKRIPRPSTLNVEVRPPLDRIVMRALERDRTRRFDRAGDMAAELNAIEGLMATDAELGQELRRYFPEELERTGMLPSLAPTEPPTESVSTAIDRMALRAAAAASEPAVESGVSTAPEPKAPSPPPPPPVTVPGLRRRKRRARRLVLDLALIGVCLLGAGGLGLWWRARLAPAPPRRLADPPAEAVQEPLAAGGTAEKTSPVVSEEALPAGDRLGETVAAAATPDVGPPAAPSTDALQVPSAARAHRASAAHPSTVIWASNVSPWAEVIVDGTSLGYTARSWKVPSGHHHLLLRNDEDGIERQFDLEFPPGGKVVLRGKLRSLQPEVVR